MTDPALLSVVQWLSPAFPVGSYACSHGLEWAISAGDITSAEDLQRWIGTVLTEGQAVLAVLHPVILQVAAKAVQAGLDQIGSGAFRSDLAAMRHETMDVRIFRT